jgi:hypothetical protein
MMIFFAGLAFSRLEFQRNFLLDCVYDDDLCAIHGGKSGSTQTQTRNGTVFGFLLVCGQHTEPRKELLLLPKLSSSFYLLLPFRCSAPDRPPRRIHTRCESRFSVPSYTATHHRGARAHDHQCQGEGNSVLLNAAEGRPRHGCVR